MSGILTPNPLYFVRQHDQPLDVDAVFATTTDRLSYLTDARRYAGQIATDIEDQKAYMLNAAKNAWIELGSGSSDSILDFTTALADTGVDLPANALVKNILVKCAAGLNYSLGVTGTPDLFIDNESLSAGVPESFMPGVFNPASIRLITNAPATAVHVKIIYQIISI